MMMSLLMAGAAAVSAPVAAPAQGWISHPAAAPEINPVILEFRRAFDLRSRPAHFPVRVTADNRFILFVNGRRVAAGPSLADIDHWREATIDLAAYLRPGRNVVAAIVWNAVRPVKIPPGATPRQVAIAQDIARNAQFAPNFQQSIATGFRLIGSEGAGDVSTDRPGWRVRREEGRSFQRAGRQLDRLKLFYAAPPPELIDAGRTDADWAGPVERATGWLDAVPAPAATRPLVADRLPPQAYVLTAPGKAVRASLPALTAFPNRAVTVPAHSKATLLLQRDAMVAAFPQLDVTGGKGSTIRVTWSEALYDAALKKGDRALVGDRTALGIWDTFLPDGGARSFTPLWWRTWRYAEIAVETGDEPLVLKGFRAYETGYPFVQTGRFSSDDPTLAPIFDIGWRTARIDAHETYMDTAYWEQLQYIGDTRLQALISYAVSGDARLAEQAIDAFAASNVDGGLMDSAYPQRFPNVIAPFGLLWVGMLDDWRMRQLDRAPVVRHLGRMREVLGWFDRWRQPSGLLGRNPQWNFIDWIGQPAQDRTRFPSYGRTNESCLMSVSWLGALQQGARIEAALGDPALATADLAKADALRRAIRSRCWVATRGLFADNPDGDLFSQHMNALAVLYDVATPDEARTILARIVTPGKGIDAPEGMATTSYYFAWYLVRAFVHAGQSDRYLALLDTWRDLLKLNYTTWPEERGDTRSDTHAWSAHPTADLLGIVAGIGPGSPGYATVRVAPALGRLKRVDAVAATPAGPVSVRYQVAGDRLRVRVTKPATLAGTFEWRGRSYPLSRITTRLTLPR